MKRDCSSDLIEWINSKNRKPLVIQGARQVGKTWLVRDFAKSQNRPLIEFNFEKRPTQESLFTSNEPKEILLNISASIGEKIDPSHAILFLDEIQQAPHLLAKLRWFAEDMPEMAVIATGSLLDFSLAKHEFSMPVGRIGYMHLEPLSFEEFLDAIGEHELRNYLLNYDWHLSIAEDLHEKCMKLIKEYLIVGGMPAAVACWSGEKDPNSVNQIHFDLLATYREDFAKYRGRLAIELLEDIMQSVPRQLGKKFVYKNVNEQISSSSLKQALDLLSKARICHRIVSTAANGLPLGAEINEKFSKVILLDCGLCATSLGLSIHQLSSISEISMINSGGMAEQLTAQLLRATFPSYSPPDIYYWQREKKGSEAEVDYVIQHEHQIIPLEVKAGKSGSLKSLHQFMNEKKKTIAVRVNSDIPRKGAVAMKDAFESPEEYTLLSIPFYLLEQLHRLIKSSCKNSKM